MFGKIDFINYLTKKAWRIGVQSNCYVTCMWCLDGFSLVKSCSFTKFAKLSPRQIFPLYSTQTHRHTDIPTRKPKQFQETKCTRPSAAHAWFKNIYSFKLHNASACKQTWLIGSSMKSCMHKYSRHLVLWMLYYF